MKKDAKKTKKGTAVGKKLAPRKSSAGSKGQWVWKLYWEDINELETRVTLYRDEARAKAAMEEDIRNLRCWEKDTEIEREDDLHATLGRFTWAITKAEVH